MVRRTVGVLVIALFMSAGIASTAWAKSERNLAKAACITGAGTWDGGTSAGGAAARAVVAAKPFSDLTAAKDNELRKVVRAVVNDPDSQSAVHAFGAWCKKHFSTVAKVSAGNYEVSLLSRKSG